MRELRAVRALACLGILMIVGSLGWTGGASGEIVAEGSFTLPTHSENATAWIAVLPGHSVSYTTSADAYISYWAEVEGQGTADGGDGGALTGCLVATHEFNFRLRWTNTQFVGAREALVTFQIELNDAGPGCTSVEDGVAANGGGIAVPPGLGLLLVNAALAGAILIAVTVSTGVVLILKREASKTKVSPVPEVARGGPEVK